MIRNFHSKCSSIESIMPCYLCKRGLLSDRIIGKGRINSIMMGWSENRKCNYSNINILVPTLIYINIVSISNAVLFVITYFYREKCLTLRYVIATI